MAVMVRNRSLALLATTAALAAGLTACVNLAPEPAPETPSQPTPAQPSPAPPQPEYLPEGSAQDNLPYFTAVLEEFSAGENSVEGQAIVDILAAAGFEKAAMQVSFDLTKTNLVADTIFVSVRIDDQCLLGQVMTGDRGIASTVEPAVGPERSLCLIGTTRTIDW